MSINYRILFLNPPANGRKLMRNFDCATESKGNYLYQPYDFLLLSSKVPNNNPFKFIDCVSDNINSEQAIKSIIEFGPDLIVIAMADSNFNDDLLFLKHLKLNINIPLVVFGDAFIDEKSQIEIRPFVQGILHNPLEINFEEVFSHIKDPWIQTKGFIKVDSYTKSNLKQAKEISIPIPKHEYFLSKKYRWPFARNYLYTTVFTAWGCPYTCSYCIMAKFPNIYRPYQEIILELDYLKDLKLKEIYIGDRSFGLPRNNCVSLLKSMIQKNYNFNWSTYFHPNQYDEELLELMAKSGCHTIIIGIESHNLTSLKKYGRHTKEDRLQKLLIHAKKLNIAICADFIIGLPEETKKDVLETIKFSKELNIDYASFNIAAPLAGTVIREIGVNNHTIENIHQYDSFGYSKALSSKYIDGKELLNLRNYAVKSFYFRIGYLIRRILNIKSLSHFIIQFSEMIQVFKKSTR